MGDEFTLRPERVTRLSRGALAAGEACQRAVALLDDQDRRLLFVSLLSAEICHAARRDDFTETLETVIASLAITATAQMGGVLDELATGALELDGRRVLQ